MYSDPGLLCCSHSSCSFWRKKILSVKLPIYVIRTTCRNCIRYLSKYPPLRVKLKKILPKMLYTTCTVCDWERTLSVLGFVHIVQFLHSLSASSALFIYFYTFNINSYSLLSLLSSVSLNRQKQVLVVNVFTARTGDQHFKTKYTMNVKCLSQENSHHWEHSQNIFYHSN